MEKVCLSVLGSPCIFMTSDSCSVRRNMNQKLGNSLRDPLDLIPVYPTTCLLVFKNLRDRVFIASFQYT